MIKSSINKLLFLVSFSVPIFGAQLPARSLSDYAFGGAGVLPVTNITFYCQSNIIKSSQFERRYFILGRERDSDFWNAFGGGRDKGENHPGITAGREFYEETIGLLFNNSTDATKYINVDNDNTEHIIAHRKGVNYITFIEESLVKKLIDNFYTARKPPIEK